MRIYFSDIERPKRTAKVLSRTTSIQLSKCQHAIARTCGYRDWHELEALYASNQASMLDEEMPREKHIERQVQLAFGLRQELIVNAGDVQHVLAISHLTGSRKPEPQEQLEIRTRLFQKIELPADVGRRKKGEVGTAKGLGPTEQQVILREYGRPTRVITHKSADGGVADFEYKSPRTPLPLFIPMRLYLIYGVWTEADGAEVLFSRDYLPLWRIRQGKMPERLAPWLRIPHVAERWFWDDSNTPWSHPSRYQTEMERLRQYRLPGLPWLVEALPIVVLDDEVRSFKDAAFVLRDRTQASLNIPEPIE